MQAARMPGWSLSRNDAVGDCVADDVAVGATSYWLAASAAGPERPPLVADDTVDIAIIGGGFTGLWTAIALTALSFVPDLTFGFNASSAATLITLHIATGRADGTAASARPA